MGTRRIGINKAQEKEQTRRRKRYGRGRHTKGFQEHVNFTPHLRGRHITIRRSSLLEQTVQLVLLKRVTSLALVELSKRRQAIERRMQGDG